MASHDVYICDVGAICNRLGLNFDVLSHAAKDALKNGLTYEVGIWHEAEGYMGVVEVQPGHTAAVCTSTIAETLEYAAESVLGDLEVFAEDGEPFKQPGPADLVREKLQRKPDVVKVIRLCHPSPGESTTRSQLSSDKDDLVPAATLS